jgi:predicted acyl esterase
VERETKLEEIEVPVFSRGNWGGLGLHLRGNTEAFTRVSSKQKWLKMHGDTHWTEYYTPEGRLLMRRFLDHFLKGEDNGWDREPPVMLQVRHPNEKFVLRHEQEWPLARTVWKPMHLDAAPSAITTDAPKESGKISFDAFAAGHTFYAAPCERRTEITGPLSATIFVSTTARDADIYLALRAFAPNGREVLFQGASDANVPLSFGWLRASHRKLDPAKSLPHRPWHPHDAEELLTPGESTGSKSRFGLPRSCFPPATGWP